MATKVTKKSELRELGCAYRRWQNSSVINLNHAYERFSQAKANAWEYCERLEAKFTGTGLRIISHNGWQFSAGFTGVDPDTGEVMFMFITKSKDWYAPITDIEEAMV